MALAASVHARPLRRVAGDAVSRIAVLVSVEGRGRRLPGGVRPRVRASRADVGQGRPTYKGGEPIRRALWRPLAGGRERGRGDRRLSRSPVPAVRTRSGPAHRPASFQGVPRPVPDPGRISAGGGRRKLRRRDRHRPGFRSPCVAFGSRPGSRTHTAGDSSRSGRHPHLVAGGNTLDGENAIGEKAPRPFLRSASRHPSRARAAERLRRRWHRTGAARGGREGRPPGPRGRQGPGRVHRRLGHEVYAEL